MTNFLARRVTSASELGGTDARQKHLPLAHLVQGRFGLVMKLGAVEPWLGPPSGDCGWSSGPEGRLNGDVALGDSLANQPR